MSSPIFTPQRKLKVVVIGAGASGLLLAYKIQRHFDDYELTVFEKNKDISGTWFENRYPGCACDVPSHCYTWSFEPKLDWSATYATAKEIYQYFRDFSTKYKLDRYIQLQHEVSYAKWDERRAQWDVEVKNLATGETVRQSCHILINAGGILNAWRFPAIPGLDTYKGELVHSAAWGENTDLRGKTVGLIGNGSSGIQILPNIKKEVKKCITFIREATWVGPPVGQDYKVYSDNEKSHFATDPEFHLQTRKAIEKGMNSKFATFFANSPEQQAARNAMLGLMKSKLHDQKLEEILIPNWSVGCRRITPGLDYLESLAEPNVEVVYGEIGRVTEKGCVVDEVEHEVDVLICATGFDTTFKPRFPLIGAKGEALSEVWKYEPKAYLGVAAHGYPNYFMTLGPNCPIGNGPVLISIEAEVEYIIGFMTKFQKENIRSFDVRKEPVENFNTWKDSYMQKMIWTEECRSWYKSGSADGKVAALWPGSTLHYIEALKTPRFEDYSWKYERGNPFAYLGNGFSSAEKRPGGDLSYYIRNMDDSPVDPCVKSVQFTEDDAVMKPNSQSQLSKL